MTPISIRRTARSLMLLLIFAAPAVARAQSVAGAGGTTTADASQPVVLPDAPAPSSTNGDHVQSAAYTPITPGQRLWWALTSTLGPHHVFGNAILASYDTAKNEPPEYGPHVAGFGDRLGIRVAGTAVSDTMEVEIGSLWGEDPRYWRDPERPFGDRLRNVFKQTFYTRRRDGQFAPAYARFIAIPGSNFLSNTWRVHSEADTGDALTRTGEGFGGQMASNAWDEFWPDIRRRIFHRHED